jgi:ABC-type branched-subunit amino acid transport system ATPase component
VESTAVTTKSSELRSTARSLLAFVALDDDEKELSDALHKRQLKMLACKTDNKSWNMVG